MRRPHALQARPEARRLDHPRGAGPHALSAAKASGEERLRVPPGKRGPDQWIAFGQLLRRFEPQQGIGQQPRADRRHRATARQVHLLPLLRRRPAKEAHRARRADGLAVQAQDAFVVQRPVAVPGYAAGRAGGRAPAALDARLADGAFREGHLAGQGIHRPQRAEVAAPKPAPHQLQTQQQAEQRQRGHVHQEHRLDARDQARPDGPRGTGQAQRPQSGGHGLSHVAVHRQDVAPHGDRQGVEEPEDRDAQERRHQAGGQQVVLRAARAAVLELRPLLGGDRAGAAAQEPVRGVQRRPQRAKPSAEVAPQQQGRHQQNHRRPERADQRPGRYAGSQPAQGAEHHDPRPAPRRDGHRRHGHHIGQKCQEGEHLHHPAHAPRPELPVLRHAAKPPLERL